MNIYLIWIFSQQSNWWWSVNSDCVGGSCAIPYDVLVVKCHNSQQTQLEPFDYIYISMYLTMYIYNTYTNKLKVSLCNNCERTYNLKLFVIWMLSVYGYMSTDICLWAQINNSMSRDRCLWVQTDIYKYTLYKFNLYLVVYVRSHINSLFFRFW